MRYKYFYSPFRLRFTLLLVLAKSFSAKHEYFPIFSRIAFLISSTLLSSRKYTFVSLIVLLSLDQETRGGGLAKTVQFKVIFWYSIVGVLFVTSVILGFTTKKNKRQ